MNNDHNFNFKINYGLKSSVPDITSHPPVQIGHALIRRSHRLPNTPTPRVFVDRNVPLMSGRVM